LQRVSRQHAAFKILNDSVRFGSFVVVELAVDLEILVGAFGFRIVQRLPEVEGFLEA